MLKLETVSSIDLLPALFADGTDCVVQRPTTQSSSVPLVSAAGGGVKPTDQQIAANEL